MSRISSTPRSVIVLWAAAVLAVAPARAFAGDAGVSSGGGAVAQNVAITIQLLWQVQQGCARSCTGTSQTQSAAQQATTVQVAASTGDAGAGAVAQNTSATIQLIVQTQLGCVAFCIGTTRVQVASQRADASQLASAISGALAASGNGAFFTQLVWQYQDVCAEACEDVDARQVVDQAANAVQSGGATADVSALPLPPVAPDLGAFTAWLATVAATATVDVVQQRDVATCLEDCDGDVQVQISVQEATTAQASVATATTAAAIPSAAGSAAPPAAATAAPVAAAVPVARAARKTNTIKKHQRRRCAPHRPVARTAIRSAFDLRGKRNGGIHCGT
jgi:hypothetical protein